MQYRAIVAQVPSTATPPAPASQSPDVALILAGIALAGSVGKQLWDYFKSDHSQDNDDRRKMTERVVEMERERAAQQDRLNQQLVATQQSSMAQMVAEIVGLRHDIGQMTKSIHSDVQESLKSEAGYYARVQAEITSLNLKADAIHRRLDEFFREMGSKSAGGG